MQHVEDHLKKSRDIMVTNTHPVSNKSYGVFPVLNTPYDLFIEVDKMMMNGTMTSVVGLRFHRDAYFGYLKVGNEDRFLVDPYLTWCIVVHMRTTPYKFYSSNDTDWNGFPISFTTMPKRDGNSPYGECRLFLGPILTTCGGMRDINIGTRIGVSDG